MNEKKIAIREQGRTTYVFPSEVECIKAERAYITIYFKNGKEKTVSDCLREYCAMLMASGKFCRVHRSWAVNIDSITEFDNHHFLKLDSGKTIPISEQGKKALTDSGFDL